MPDLVLVDTIERVRVVTLNRPEARNALDTGLQRASAAALTAAEADDGIDVVVLTGADPAFCAGLDLRELGSTGDNLKGGSDEPTGNPFAALWRMTKPVIGAINGPCVTGQWITAATRILAGGQPVLLQDSQAICTPTGTGLQVVVTQPRVRAT